MIHMGARLRRFREWLPETPDGAPAPRQGLSLALGWSDSRWRQLEMAAEWSDQQLEDALDGTKRILDMLKVTEEEWQQVVAFIQCKQENLPVDREHVCWDRSPFKPRGRPRTRTQGGVPALAAPQAASAAVEVAKRTICEAIKDAVAGVVPVKAAQERAALALLAAVQAAGVVVAVGPDFWELLQLGGL